MKVFKAKENRPYNLHYANKFMPLHKNNRTTATTTTTTTIGKTITKGEQNCKQTTSVIFISVPAATAAIAEFNASMISKRTGRNG